MDINRLRAVVYRDVVRNILIMLNNFNVPNVKKAIYYPFVINMAETKKFLSKGQWTDGPTLCLSIDTLIRS